MNSGRTYDDLEVKREYGLTLGFSWFPSGEKQMFWSIGVSLEFNEDALGRHWPFLCLQLGKRTWQVGWLWG